ncbi:hypothetical protein H4696_005614 [Amycolatopsis lexingtonensis]|uniref:Uncharacterized protein n=1 Tax=Amycolatopsis lexingtonensis TaxID=218822 RepID=A0ABR9I5Q4_9PSEU|nr:hypothetical protein [Amycolatopsis lexingtonensis]
MNESFRTSEDLNESFKTAGGPVTGGTRGLAVEARQLTSDDGAAKVLQSAIRLLVAPARHHAA